MKHTKIILSLLANLSFGCAVQVDSQAPTEGAPAEAAPVESSEQGWDSQNGNPTHATHSYLTEYAIAQLSPSHPELATYRARLVDGANRELHELPVKDPEQEALRRELGGTNWAADHPERAFAHAYASYHAGDKGKAYWYVGVLLHYVEDMGVPAHAFHVIHQGSFAQLDGFEALALVWWHPSYAAIGRVDPKLAAPSDYVAYSGRWAADDFAASFPQTTYTRSTFPAMWLLTSAKQRAFVHDREGRTAVVTTWALERAVELL